MAVIAGDGAFSRACLGANDLPTSAAFHDGAAGPRRHLPGGYAAYLRDPADNKVCAYTFTDDN